MKKTGFFPTYLALKIKSAFNGSPVSFICKALLFILTGVFAIKQIQGAPYLGAIAFLWLIFLLDSQIRASLHRHHKISLWTKENLFSSAFNICLTLFLTLILSNIVLGIWDYAIQRATFSPALTAPKSRPAGVGASWGVIIGASKLLMTGTLEMEHMPRVWAAFWILVGLGSLTLFVNKKGLYASQKMVRRVIHLSWAIYIAALALLLVGVSPRPNLFSAPDMLKGALVISVIYLLLCWNKIFKFQLLPFILSVCCYPLLYALWGLIGQTQLFPPINVERWGGLLLTLIITIFASIFSFPIGIALALGRRSKASGIPGWFIWTCSIAVTLWEFMNSTPALLSSARSDFEKVFAFWPISILLIAYLFQRFFKGNVISATSSFLIETIRGVPLITILFMAIVMAPLFLREGTQLKNTWSVLIGYTIFNSAYLAEIVRGGLDAIPIGQTEAADSLGLNGLQKIRLVILPQALHLVIPELVNLFVGLFKATSVVGIVGLFDLMGIVSSVTGNPEWQGLRTELYIFAAMIYFIGSYAMSAYSQKIEKQISRTKH